MSSASVGRVFVIADNSVVFGADASGTAVCRGEGGSPPLRPRQSNKGASEETINSTLRPVQRLQSRELHNPHFRRAITLVIVCRKVTCDQTESSTIRAAIWGVGHLLRPFLLFVTNGQKITMCENIPAFSRPTESPQARNTLAYTLLSMWVFVIFAFFCPILQLRQGATGRTFQLTAARHILEWSREHPCLRPGRHRSNYPQGMRNTALCLSGPASHLVSGLDESVARRESCAAATARLTGERGH